MSNQPDMSVGESLKALLAILLFILLGIGLFTAIKDCVSGDSPTLRYYKEREQVMRDYGLWKE